MNEDEAVSGEPVKGMVLQLHSELQHTSLCLPQGEGDRHGRREEDKERCNEYTTLEY